VKIASLAAAAPFTTADGSTIRELFGQATTRAEKQSLAEASLPPGGSTERHYHRETEEIYFVLEGSGTMELDGEEAPLAAGDAVLIPPGAWHQITASGGGGLRFVCCCAPPYSHDDTFFT
jgi:mannose-6-phosphate isomerase-like protein (cupin superfamily)